MVAKPEDYYEKEAFKRLKNFADAQQETPFLVVDSATFTRQLDGLIESFPYAKTYYAIKANPMPELLRILRDRGCNFDVASRYELDKVLAVACLVTVLVLVTPLKRHKMFATSMRKA